MVRWRVSGWWLKACARPEQVCPVRDAATGAVTHYLGQLEDFSQKDAGIARNRLDGLGWAPRSWLEPRVAFEVATQPCSEARVLTEARAPFRILCVNDAWQAMCGFTSSEVVGQTMTVIQGKRTDRTALAFLGSRLVNGQHCSVILCNYKRSGEPFINFLQVSPVVDAAGYVTHFIGQLEDLSSQQAASRSIAPGFKCDGGGPCTRATPPSVSDSAIKSTVLAVAGHQAAARPPCPAILPSAEDAASEVLVGLQAPAMILNATKEFLLLMDLSLEACVGNPLSMLRGPETNMQKLFEMLDAAAAGREAEATVVLYSRLGVGSYYQVHSKPFGSPLKPTGCLLSMISAHAVSEVAALSDDGSIKAVVDAANFRAVYLSRAFEKTYGLTSSVVLGRTLNVIHGPGTDLSAWRTMLSQSSRGARGKCALVTATSDCMELLNDIEFRPVLNKHGYVSHVLVEVLQGALSRSAGNMLPPELSPPREMGVCCAPVVLTVPNATGLTSMQCPGVPRLARPDAHVNECTPPPGASLHHGPVGCTRTSSSQELSSIFKSCDAEARPALSRSTSQESLEESLASFAVSDLNEDVAAGRTRCQDVACAAGGPVKGYGATGTGASIRTGVRHTNVFKVVPKRRPGQSMLHDTQPVCITADTVEELSGSMSLAKASDVLGISSTAMKKACRRLGIKRWRQDSQPESAVPPQIDSAYIRRLQRKHTASRRKSSQPSSKWGGEKEAEGASPQDAAQDSPPSSTTENGRPADGCGDSGGHHGASAADGVAAASREENVFGDDAGPLLFANRAGACEWTGGGVAGGCDGGEEMFAPLAPDALLLLPGDWEGTERAGSLMVDCEDPIVDCPAPGGWLL
jgi:PAS domain S-box-containing protein